MKTFGTNAPSIEEEMQPLSEKRGTTLATPETIPQKKPVSNIITGEGSAANFNDQLGGSRKRQSRKRSV
jgi:hypothetical protein